MRLSFKIVLMILSIIPLLFAVKGLSSGAAGNNGGVEVSAGLDNQYRYFSGYYLSLFFGVWYVLRDIDTRGTVFRFLVLAIFIGGIGRLISYVQVGVPPADGMIGMVLELGSPLLVLWHRAIERSAGPVVP